MHLMLDFSYNLDSVFSHELCKSAFSDGIFWDSGVEPHSVGRTLVLQIRHQLP